MSKWNEGTEHLKSMAINKDKIPTELIDRPQWVSWGGTLNDDGSLNKVPINPKTNRSSSSIDPETWGTIDEALHCTTNHKRYGIGFVFTEEDEYMGIDLDYCIDQEGHMHPTAQDIVGTFQSYTEITPSKRGVHIIIKGKIPEDARNKKNDPNLFDDPKSAVEAYSKSRYFTVTTKIVGVFNTIKEIDDTTLSEFFTKYLPPRKPAVITRMADSKAPISMPDEALITKMKEADNGDKFSRLWAGDISGHDDDDSKADMALCGILAFWAQNNAYKINSLFKLSGLYRPKWERRLGDTTYGYYTINNAMSSKLYNPEGYNRPKIDLIEVADEDYKTDDLIFPAECMAGLAKEFSRLYSDHLESPEQFFFFGFLTCLGTLFADRVTLNSETNPQPRLFTVLLGESADDRKSTVLKKVSNIFSGYDDGFRICWGTGSAEGLSDLFEVDKRLILCYDELKHFVQKSTIASSVLLPCIGTLFENNRFETNTKNKHILMEDVYLSLIAASTVDTYETMFKSTFTDIGFTNRLWIVPGRSTKRISLPPPVPEEEINKIKAGIDNMNWKLGTYTKLSITDEAFTLYNDWYINMTRSVHTKRLETYAKKLMILLTINEGLDEVCLETMEKVIKFCDWQLAVRKKYDPIDAENIYADMEQRVIKHLDRGMLTKRELKQLIARTIKRVGVKYFENTLRNLKESGDIEEVKAGKTVKYRMVSYEKTSE